jgi:hypothetical protein
VGCTQRHRPNDRLRGFVCTLSPPIESIRRSTKCQGLRSVPAPNSQVSLSAKPSVYPHLRSKPVPELGKHDNSPFGSHKSSIVVHHQYNYFHGLHANLSREVSSPLAIGFPPSQMSPRGGRSVGLEIPKRSKPSGLDWFGASVEAHPRSVRTLARRFRRRTRQSDRMRIATEHIVVFHANHGSAVIALYPYGLRSRHNARR